MTALTATVTSEEDWWTVCPHDYGHDVGCRSLKTFLAFLLSPGTHSAHLQFHNPTHNRCRIILMGTIADDFERLSLDYVLTADEVHTLSYEDKVRMVARLLQLWGEPNNIGHHPLTAVIRSLNLSR